MEIFARHGADAFVKAGSNQGEAFRPGGGESTGELHARVAAFLKDVAGSEGDAVAVAHLGVLRAAYTLGHRLGHGDTDAGGTGCVEDTGVGAGQRWRTEDRQIESGVSERWRNCGSLKLAAFVARFAPPDLLHAPVGALLLTPRTA